MSSLMALGKNSRTVERESLKMALDSHINAGYRIKGFVSVILWRKKISMAILKLLVRNGSKSFKLFKHFVKGVFLFLSELVCRMFETGRRTENQAG